VNPPIFGSLKIKSLLDCWLFGYFLIPHILRDFPIPFRFLFLCHIEEKVSAYGVIGSILFCLLMFLSISFLKENMYKYTALRNKCRSFVHIRQE
jgi:hypothetical protein